MTKKEYYIKNKERIRLYYKNNRDKKLSYQKDYNSINKDKYIKYQKEYRMAHRRSNV